MPPRRPLPDLCLISVFKLLTPNDQLRAAKTSFRCTVLVRAANRRVKTLVISMETSLNEAQCYINSFYLGSEPSVRLLTDENGQPQYPVPRITKWNNLQLTKQMLRNLFIFEQIINAFSAVTDLKMVSMPVGEWQYQAVIGLLAHRSGWARSQLTEFTFCEHHQYRREISLKAATARRLFNAINGLSSLEQLILRWTSKFRPPAELPIFAQLKAVTLDIYESENAIEPFRQSLERAANAGAGDDFQVTILSSSLLQINLLNFSAPLRNRIVCVGFPLRCPIFASIFCQHLSALTSLDVLLYGRHSAHFQKLFVALSSLPNLVHLSLSTRVEESGEEAEEEKGWNAPHPPPIQVLPSIRALTLDLTVLSHQVVPRLCLTATMPNLQVLHLQYFECHRCNIRFGDEEGRSISRPQLPPDVRRRPEVTCSCLRHTLANLHAGVCLSKVIFKVHRSHHPDTYNTIEWLFADVAKEVEKELYYLSFSDR